MLKQNIRRPHFYNGRRMSSQEFKDNQNYHILMRTVQNSFYHNKGVLSGLTIAEYPEPTDDSFEPDLDDPAIVVRKGFGFVNHTFTDSRGNEEQLLREVVLPEDEIIHFKKLAVYQKLEAVDSIDLTITIEFDEYKDLDSTYDDKNRSYKGPELIQNIEKARIRVTPITEKVPTENDYIILGECTLSRQLIPDTDRYGAIVEVTTSDSETVFPLLPMEGNHADHLVAWYDYPSSKVDMSIIPTDTKWESYEDGRLDMEIPTLDESFVTGTQIKKEEVKEKYIKLRTSVLKAKYVATNEEPYFKVQDMFLLCKMETEGFNDYPLLTFSAAATVNNNTVFYELKLQRNSFRKLEIIASGANISPPGAEITINGLKDIEVPLGEWFILYAGLTEPIDAVSMDVKDTNPEWTFYLSELILYDKRRWDKNHDARGSFVQYLINKYDADFSLSSQVRPAVTYQARGGECEKLALDRFPDSDSAHVTLEPSGDPAQDVLFLRGDQILISGEKIVEDMAEDNDPDDDVFMTLTDKRAEVTVEKNMKVNGTMVVEGDFSVELQLPNLENDNEAFLLTKELVLGDNVITLNQGNKKEDPGLGIISGIEVYLNETGFKPAIKWEEKSGAWIADDGVKSGVIAYGLPENLNNEALADDIHYHEFLAQQEGDTRFRVVEVRSDYRVHIRGTADEVISDPSTLTPADALLLGGDIAVDAIKLPPQNIPGSAVDILYPDGLTIDRADETLDISKDHYTHIFNPREFSRDQHTEKLQGMIGSNTSILIGDGELYLDSAIYIFNVFNLRISGGALTTVVTNDFDPDHGAFTIGGSGSECGNITIENLFFEPEGAGTLVRVKNKVEGLNIKNCRHLTWGNAKLLHGSSSGLSTSFELIDLAITGNVWKTTRKSALHIQYLELIQVLIKDNDFNFVDSNSAGPILRFDEVVCVQVVITYNRMSGENGYNHFKIRNKSKSIDFSHNTYDMIISVFLDDPPFPVGPDGNCNWFDSGEGTSVAGLKARANCITLRPTYDSADLTALNFHNIDTVLATDNLVSLNGRYCSSLAHAGVRKMVLSNNVLEGMSLFGPEANFSGNLLFIKPLEFYVKIQRTVNEISLPIEGIVRVLNNGQIVCERTFSGSDNGEPMTVDRAEESYNYQFQVDVPDHIPEELPTLSVQELLTYNSALNPVIIELEPRTFTFSLTTRLESPSMEDEFAQGNVSLRIRVNTADTDPEDVVTLYGDGLEGADFNSGTPLSLPLGFEEYEITVSQTGYETQTLSLMSTDIDEDSAAMTVNLKFPRFDAVITLTALDLNSNTVEPSGGEYTLRGTFGDTTYTLSAGSLKEGENHISFPSTLTKYILEIQREGYNPIRREGDTIEDFSLFFPLEQELTIKEVTFQFQISYRNPGTYTRESSQDFKARVSVLAEKDVEDQIQTFTLLEATSLEQGHQQNFDYGFDRYIIIAEADLPEPPESPYAPFRLEIPLGEIGEVEGSYHSTINIDMEFEEIPSHVYFSQSSPDEDYTVDGDYSLVVETEDNVVLLPEEYLHPGKISITAGTLEEGRELPLPGIFEQYWFKLYDENNVVKWQSDGVPLEALKETEEEPLEVTLTPADFSFTINLTLPEGGGTPELYINENKYGDLAAGLNQVTVQRPIVSLYTLEIRGSGYQTYTTESLPFSELIDTVLEINLETSILNLYVAVTGWKSSDVPSGPLSALVELLNAEDPGAEALWSGTTEETADATVFQVTLSLDSPLKYLIRISKEGYFSEEREANTFADLSGLSSSENPLEISLDIETHLVLTIQRLTAGGLDSNLPGFVTILGKDEGEDLDVILVDNRETETGEILTIPWAYFQYSITVSGSGEEEYTPQTMTLDKDQLIPSEEPYSFSFILKEELLTYINLELNPPGEDYQYNGDGEMIFLDKDGNQLYSQTINISENRASGLEPVLTRYIGPYTCQVIYGDHPRWEAVGLTQDELSGHTAAEPLTLSLTAAAFRFNINVTFDAGDPVPGDLRLSVENSSTEEELGEVPVKMGLNTIDLKEINNGQVISSYILTVKGEGYDSNILPSPIPFYDLWEYEDKDAEDALTFAMKRSFLTFFVKASGWDKDQEIETDLPAVLSLSAPGAEGGAYIFYGPVDINAGVNEITAPLPVNGTGQDLFRVQVTKDGYAAAYSGQMTKAELQAFTNDNPLELKLIIQIELRINIQAVDPSSGQLAISQADLIVLGDGNDLFSFDGQAREVSNGEILTLDWEHEEYEIQARKDGYKELSRRYKKSELNPGESPFDLYFDFYPPFVTHLEFRLIVPANSGYVPPVVPAHIEALDSRGTINMIQEFQGLSSNTEVREVTLPDNSEGEYTFDLYERDTLRWKSAYLGRSVLAGTLETPAPVELIPRGFSFFLQLSDKDNPGNEVKPSGFQAVITESDNGKAVKTVDLAWGIQELTIETPVAASYDISIRAEGYENQILRYTFYALWAYTETAPLYIELELSS